MIYDRGLEFRF